MAAKSGKRGRVSVVFGPFFCCFVFLGEDERPQNWKLRKRFVSAGFAFGGGFELPCFKAMWCKKALQNLAKMFCVKKKLVRFFFVRAVFRAFFGAPLFGVGFPAARSAFLGPYNARKRQLWSSWSGRKIAALVFFGAFSLQCRVFWGGNWPTPCGFARWDSDTSQHVAGLTLWPTNPWKLPEINAFGLVGFSLMIYQNLPPPTKAGGS